MFAVPGWSLPKDSLKRQTADKPTQAPPASAPEGQDAAGSTGGKNKRKGTGPDVKVTRANLDEMFRKHIQGEGSKPESKKKNDTKKRKLDNEGSDETDKKSTGETKPADAVQEGPKRKRNRKPKNKQQQGEKQGEQSSTENATSVETPTVAPAAAAAAPLPAPSKLTPLQQSMRNKLLAARFRYLNEQLYTTPSSEAYKLFTENPDFFNEYHAGFTRQVQELWPSNPVDWYIQSIKTRGAVRPQSRDRKNKSGPEALPRRPNGSCTIADMGCGDAKLAHSLVPQEKKLKLKFHNFDLQSPDPLVTKADIANLPLADGSCDVAVFCLSLMGTNWISFVEEAWRVLRSDGKGECWVSEVKSRFGKVSRRKSVPDHSISKRSQKKMNKKKKGKDDDEEVNDDDIFAENRQETDQGDDTDISAFVEVFKSRGFVLKQETVDKSNKMFVRMEFVKHGAVTKGKHAGAAGSQAGRVQKKFIEKEKEDELTPEQEAQVLKPCLYKLR
ncbi:Methyltransferase-related protein [Ascosphaera apis ARSEF 7405]|uniref:Ribosomal RNA-processing protein 8 n=1 Tax=Ascosphaera apis ARSEF 7405 TaxID=392613 RepID=A0A167ZVL6_9EURO|nr:Methyltransferase-related protein [Ascosphaera apis ARSEF 7405]